MKNRFSILALLATLATVPASADRGAGADLSHRVAATLRVLPNYGPFDALAFEIDGGRVTLSGEVGRGVVRTEAERAVASLDGIDEVVNRVEVLPVSGSDDRIRRRVFDAIYGDPVLARYGSPERMTPMPHARHASRRSRGGRIAGLPPFGKYAIHVVVNGGAVRLVGLVDNDADRTKAELDVRGVFGVTTVTNEIDLTTE